MWWLMFCNKSEGRFDCNLERILTLVSLVSIIFMAVVLFTTVLRLKIFRLYSSAIALQVVIFMTSAGTLAVKFQEEWQFEENDWVGHVKPFVNMLCAMTTVFVLASYYKLLMTPTQISD